MIVPNNRLLAYLLHRVGEKQLDSSPIPCGVKALEGNKKGPSFIETFGNCVINAYVGFIDLAEFSTRVQGKYAQEIADYLFPFLKKIIEVLGNRFALIDKMIGDEIMFVLPDFEEIGMPPSILLLGQIFGWLHDLAFEMEPNYRYRIGLSYGEVLVAHLQAESYSEWTIVGEPVHVAKRLEDIEELKNPNPVLGAFGLRINRQQIEEIYSKMENILAIIAGFASRFDHKLNSEPKKLKGVGEVLWALLFPKSSNN